MPNGVWNVVGRTMLWNTREWGFRVHGARYGLRAALAASLVVLLAACASAPLAPAPRDIVLDWSARNRWVHIDTVATDRVALFEDARARWLRTLRATGGALPDGRPLFWSGRHGTVQTYFTFYPFDRFADLDARKQAVTRTQTSVGQAAVTDYDSGDAALVPPHYTQVWTRDVDLDFVSPVAGELDERSAGYARIEFQQLNYDVADRGAEIWKSVTDALRAQRYPVSCRSFFASYGTGLTVRLWLAKDAEALAAAAPIAQVLQRELGAERGRALARDYEALMSTQDSFDLQRRDELSNLSP